MSVLDHRTKYFTPIILCKMPTSSQPIPDNSSLFDYFKFLKRPYALFHIFCKWEKPSYFAMDSFPDDDRDPSRSRRFSDDDEDLYQERALFWETDGVQEAGISKAKRRFFVVKMALALALVLAVVMTVRAMFKDPANKSHLEKSLTVTDTYYPLPSNNECINAIPLNVSQSTDVNNPSHFVYGTVLGANKSPQGRFSQCLDLLPLVPDHTEALDGVWYSLLGNGESIRVSTCDRTEMDTLISVFVPESDKHEPGYEYCDNLECIAVNDDACGLQASVRWETVEGETYFIYVQGSVGFELDQGNFALSVHVDNEIEPNDSCDEAIEIEPDQGVIFGSNFAASAVGVEYIAPCGVDGFNFFSEGVWYVVVSPTAKTLEVSTCKGSDFDTVLHVFSGTCNDLVCMIGDENSCGWNSRLEFQAEAGKPYYIYVHGGWTGSRGKFGLEVSTI